MNAPKEYYPVGYEKNFDDNFTTKVDLPPTTFHCGDQKHFPGLYGDVELGCMVRNANTTFPTVSTYSIYFTIKSFFFHSLEVKVFGSFPSSSSVFDGFPLRLKHFECKRSEINQ